MPDGEPELRARGEEAIGFVHPASDQVVDQNADVRCFSTEIQWLPTSGGESRIESRDDSLSSCLLVPCCAVDLPCEVEPMNGANLE